MNIRSEVHNAITKRFSRLMPPSTESFKIPIFENRTCSFPISINNWIPWCNYVQLYPKQFAMARLLIRYRMLPLRIEVRKFPLLLSDGDTILSGWSVFAIDCKSSLVLACVTGTHQSPGFECFSKEPVCEEPLFVFNHLDGLNPEVLDMRDFIVDFKLKLNERCGIKKYLGGRSPFQKAASGIACKFAKSLDNDKQ